MKSHPSPTRRQVRDRAPVVAAAGRQLTLDAGHGRGVCGLGCKAPLKVRHLVIAQLGGDAVQAGLDPGDVVVQHLVLKTAADLVALVHPGVHVVSAESTAEASAPASQENEQEDDPPPVAVSHESAVVWLMRL